MHSGLVYAKNSLLLSSFNANHGFIYYCRILNGYCIMYVYLCTMHDAMNFHCLTVCFTLKRTFDYISLYKMLFKHIVGFK